MNAPNSSEHYLIQGDSFVARQAFNEAIRSYQEALSIDANSVAAHGRLFQIYQHLGMGEQAIASLSSVACLSPTMVGADTHLMLASHFEQREQFDEAHASLGRAIQLDPSNPAPAIKSAELYLTEGDCTLALEKLRETLRQFPQLGQVTNAQHVDLTFPARIERLRCFIAGLRSTYNRCEATLHARNIPFDSHLIDALGFARAGRFSKALNCLARSHLASSARAESQYLHGIIFGSWSTITGNKKLIQRAQGELEGARALDPQWADIAHHLGKVRRSLYWHGPSTYEESLHLQLDAVQRDPTLLDAASEAFDIMQRLGKWPDALALMKHHAHAREETLARNPLRSLPIRFFKDFAYAMGHLSFLPEVYLKMELLGWYPKRQKILVASPALIANRSLLEYWSPHFTILSDQDAIEGAEQFIEMLEEDSTNITLPDGRVLAAPAALSVVQAEWDRQNRAPVLTLTERDRSRGWDCLEKYGIPRSTWFVTLHVREAGFKNEGNSLHNLHRNSDIESYIPAIQEIVRRGGWVIRLGEPTMKPLPQMAQVFDYAHSLAKSDWMDVFLCGAARFFLGSSGGVISVPQTFGVPLVATNFPPATIQHGKNDLMIPKLMFHERLGRLLTFREMLSPPFVHNQEGRFMQEQGIRWVDNTTEDLVEITREMLNRLDGTATYDAKIELLQNKYRSYLDHGHGEITLPLGSHFLKKYEALFSEL